MKSRPQEAASSLEDFLNSALEWRRLFSETLGTFFLVVVAAGGGVDFRILPFFAWRINGDYINAPTQSPSSSSHERFGTGLVFRF